MNCPECDFTHEPADCDKVRFVLQSEDGSILLPPTFIVDREKKMYLHFLDPNAAERHMQRLNQDPELAKTPNWRSLTW